MSQEMTGPNPQVREVYDELGELLEQGDDVFIEKGPDLLKEAIKDPGFFDGVETEHAEPGCYTRKKVIGDEGEHVIRFMEWPPEFTLLPHEHHGRPCFEVLVDGLLSVVDMEAEEVGDRKYEMSVLDTNFTRPGESAVVDPRVNDIHAVYSPVRSRSLHVYPDDNHYSYGYVLEEEKAEKKEGKDVYTRKKFKLSEE